MRLNVFRMGRGFFNRFINDELGKEYADRVLGQGTRRWTEMGFLSDEGAEEIMQDDKIASIAYNFGVHLATGFLTPTGIGTFIAMSCRSSYTLAKGYQARKRKDKAMARIHCPAVVLVALIPMVGNFSYPLVHLGGRSRSLGIFIDEGLGTPVIRRCEGKPLIGRIRGPYYTFIRRWFNDKPLYDFVVRWFKRPCQERQAESQGRSSIR